MPNYYALIPAAGFGSRMGGETPKQYLSVLGRPLIHYAVAALCRHAVISGVYVVLAPEDQLWKSYDWSAFAGKLKPLYCGGAERFESVRNGLDAIRDEVDFEDWVLVHDAARPGLSEELLDRLIGEVGEDPFGGLLAVPVADTLKRADADSRVLRTEPRDKLWQAQTPQMFRYGLLQRALSLLDGAVVTDEAQAIERMGFQAKLVVGDMTNFKVTYPQDIKLTELILGDKA
ncbi:2-C-methyl-D-erythritol 4-phosphate cytidylyltransferase [Sulfuricella denitrificans skB26]|uniref:2-C-methyl-D-erythritol 4-phosphate cytidylyltransferase n=1 Tax=Sulfuricella denitrificans (strain DSM 22764 / NBRC 105220 / skB26) TaxID=1163617 RepID=S6B4Q6_SULDS|nr:2-C-methyl-D-erythritol 4-phosphate cytidylyltransferase [Sulfuricella denitrificans]BAN35572.1 2-C-methyl-D-erythritol 4-phosphate cytidylyltransferase [Sulfuricella denitrificans skB26]